MTADRRRRSLLKGAAAFASLIACPALADRPDPKSKPKLTPGQDPGGVAVAVIGPGVDYADPDMAKRLARDGEGEPIGWDFIDGDNRPYGREPAVVEALARLAVTARFVVVRTASLDGNLRLPALGFVSRTPARIVLMVTPAADPAERADVEKAAGALPGHLLVLPVAQGTPAPAAYKAANVLAVGAGPGTGNGERPALIVAPDGEAARKLEKLAREPDLAAAVAVASLATHLATRDKSASGAALRDAILKLAAPGTGPAAPPTIADFSLLLPRP